MPRNPKLFLNDMPYFITCSTEEGLPFAANPLIELIIRGILAKAANMYDITICHIELMANHIHLVIVVRNPEHVARFMQYFKRESSHSINRLLGRKKRTIWCDRYDSPVVLDAERLANVITYLYTNPVKDNLVEKVEDYPCLLYTSPSPRDATLSRMPSSA